MRFLIAILALAGVAVASLALRVHYSTETEPCSINEKWDCGIVNRSPYAVVAHIPVAAIGIAGYVMLALLALLRRRRMLAALAAIGFAFSLYLTYIEHSILQVYCLYCVISFAIITLIAVVSFLWAMAAARRRTAA